MAETAAAAKTAAMMAKSRVRRQLEARVLWRLARARVPISRRSSLRYGFLDIDARHLPFGQSPHVFARRTGIRGHCCRFFWSQTRQ